MRIGEVRETENSRFGNRARRSRERPVVRSSLSILVLGPEATTFNKENPRLAQELRTTDAQWRAKIESRAKRRLLNGLEWGEEKGK